VHGPDGAVSTIAAVEDGLKQAGILLRPQLVPAKRLSLFMAFILLQGSVIRGDNVNTSLPKFSENSYLGNPSRLQL
jgi:hypothetical protein